MGYTPDNKNKATSAPPVGRQAGPGELTAEQVARIRASVLALEPMSDAQIAGVCEVIATARHRWRPGPAPGADL